jgi:hypothetical protein
MKRHRVITTIIILSLLLVGTFPASASTGPVNKTAHIGATVKLYQDILNTLPDGSHDASAGNQNQFSCLAEGWATDPDDRSIDLNVRILSDDGEVAQVVADVFRQDLADVGVCPDGTCSFSVNLWGLISPDTDHLITVQAQDAQTGEWANVGDTPKTLNCSEVNVLPEGFHESHFEGSQNQFSCFAVGWAADPDDRSADLNIRIFSDNIEVAQTVANIFRQDLYDAGVCQDGTCNFSVDLWGLIAPGVDHSITVHAQDAQTGEWVDLSTTPRTLNCSEVNVLPEGFHDFSEGIQNQFSCVAIGWAADPNDRDIDLNVRILSDGVEVAQTVADIFREGLDAAGACPGGTCSFSVNLWGLISPDTDHLITVQAQDAQSGEWVDLSNTPKTLNCAGPSWQQVNTSGFGDSQTSGVISLEVFQNDLYAGTANGAGGAVWRWQQDGQWQPVSEAGFGSGSANPAIVDLAVFQGKLYAGMGWDDAPGQVWRSANGTNWQPVTTNGFGDDGNIAITNFVVFKGAIYAGTGTINSSAQIWRSSSGNSNSWTKVAPDGPGLIGNVTGFAVYKNVLYAAVEPPSGVDPAQVWRSTNGSDWTNVTADGFGDPNNTSTGGFTQFGGYLYLGIRNDVTGGQIWRTLNGLNWELVVNDGFGDSSNIKVESFLIHDDLFYAVTFNLETGLHIWRSVDGNSWEQVISNGFGDSNNFSTLWNNATLEYQGHILIGTWNNVDGGELWMSTP